MARYYFHVREMNQLVTDDQGVELPDKSAALLEAQQSARDLLADAIMAGKDRIPEEFVIADEQGREIATVPLAAVLPEPLKKQCRP
jgi:uncharacterized protein DUF6894